MTENQKDSDGTGSGKVARERVQLLGHTCRTNSMVNNTVSFDIFMNRNDLV